MTDRLTGRIETSRDNPLQVNWVSLLACKDDAKGRLGITFAPGKQGPAALSDVYHYRSMEVDMKAIRGAGAHVLVTLMEDAERQQYGVENMGEVARENGLLFLSIPTPDLSVPTSTTARGEYKKRVETVARAVRSGAVVVVSCRGGRGRAGTFAALVLCALGMTGKRALETVRTYRQGAVETPIQEAFVLRQALYVRLSKD